MKVYPFHCLVNSRIVYNCERIQTARRYFVYEIWYRNNNNYNNQRRNGLKVNYTF